MEATHSAVCTSGVDAAVLPAPMRTKAPRGARTVGACNRAIVMKHCPASCGLCEDREYLERHMELANMYGEMNHRQLKKTC